MSELFIPNKYTSWYYSIIKNALLQSRIKGGEEYYEAHHTIPRSLGGTETVLLTAREHYICHWLLTKMLEGQNKYRMWHAFWKMNIAESSEQKRYLNSRGFEIARAKHCEAVSALLSGRKLSDKELDERQGDKNPNARFVVMEGLEFGSRKSAAEYFGITPKQVLSVIRSERLLDDILNPKPRPKKPKVEKPVRPKKKRVAWNKNKPCSDAVRAKMSKSKMGKSVSIKSYRVEDPNGKTYTIESGGIRKFWREELNSKLPTAFHSISGSFAEGQKGKWKGWKVFVL